MAVQTYAVSLVLAVPTKATSNDPSKPDIEITSKTVTAIFENFCASAGIGLLMSRIEEVRDEDVAKAHITPRT